MFEKEPLVSIVTPFYNTDEYLAECIESVLAQTYQNWEYILVNNCSTDRSAEIAQSYVERDKRVRLIHNKSFLTQVQNYNHALRQISSETKYCKIVQADDWIFPSCLEKMVQLADAYPKIGIIGSYSLYGDRVQHDSLPLNCGNVFLGLEAIKRYLLTDRGFIGSPTCVMFRSDLVRSRNDFFELAFPDFEDAEACLELLYHCDFGFIYQVLTFNRRDNKSIWQGIKHLNPVLLHKLLLIIKHGPKVLNAEEYRQRRIEVEDEYYSMLARVLLQLRNNNKFWCYHRDGFRSQGLTIDRMRLARKIFLEIINILMNPKISFGRLISWIRR